MRYYTFKHTITGKYYNPYTVPRSGPIKSECFSKKRYFIIEEVKNSIHLAINGHTKFSLLKDHLDKLELEAYELSTIDFKFSITNIENVEHRKQVCNSIKNITALKVTLSKNSKGFSIKKDCYTKVPCTIKLNTLKKRIEADIIMNKLRKS